MRRTTVVLASMLLAVTAFTATFGLWVAADVADEQVYVDAALVAFEAEGSDDAIGELVAAEVVERFPGLQLFEFGLATLFSVLIPTDPFLPLRVGVSEQIHAVVVDGEHSPVLVDLGDYRAEILSSVAAISPDLADRIPEGAFTTFVIFEQGELPDGSGAVRLVTILGWVALGLALALVAVLVLGARDAVVSFIAIGCALVFSAAATVAMVTIARGSIGDAAESEAYAVLGTNLFDVLVGSLVGRAAVIGIIGAVMVAVALVIRFARPTGGQV